MDWTKLEEFLNPDTIGNKLRMVRLRPSIMRGKLGKDWYKDVWFKDKSKTIDDYIDGFISNIEEYACCRAYELGDDI